MVTKLDSIRARVDAIASIPGYSGYGYGDKLTVIADDVLTNAEFAALLHFLIQAHPDIPLLLALAEACVKRDAALEAERKFRVSLWYADSVEGDTERALAEYKAAASRSQAARDAYDAAIAPLLAEQLDRDILGEQEA